MHSNDLVKIRLTNQRLAEQKFKRATDAVSFLGAVQAQDYNAAKWALALRSDNETDLTIEDAFNKGKILRTHVMRPTWHFVSPGDIRWLLDLTAPRVNTICGHYYRKLELDEKFFRRTHKVISKELQREKYLTRAELRERLIRQRIDPGDAIRMSFILLRAELDGLVCSGPRRGKQFTYALLDERVAKSKEITREEALAKLTLTYFTGHGPATIHDYSWWSGLALSDVRTGLEMVGKKLQHDGEYHLSETHADGIPDVILLPAFDEYLVGYTDRSAAVTATSKQTDLPNAIFRGVILVRGLVKGEWRRKNVNKKTVIEVNSWSNMSKPVQKALERAASLYGNYTGVMARVDLPSARS
jgi:hypothetical protein